jgi:hypothetical protein
MIDSLEMYSPDYKNQYCSTYTKDSHMDPELPPFLSVPEAARVLRISRAAAYELVNAWLATNGEEGLPVIRLGRRTLRVPRTAIERLLATG